MSENVEKKQIEYPYVFGNFVILDRINVGGMAEIFRAKSVSLEGIERLVAIKRILPHLLSDPDFSRMFKDEARIAFSLHHANIAQLYEIEEFKNSPYIVMEYVRGKDLRSILNRCFMTEVAIPLDITLSIIAQVCDGLDYAHRKKDLSQKEMAIVHRDISPQNVIVSYDGSVKVIDFGIAKAATKSTHTEAGMLKGKFGYMSPEQVMGREVDRRADLFCAGILLYETVVGERLFQGSSDLSTLRKIRDNDWVHPQKIKPGLPEELTRILMKMLAHSPSDRYSYGSEIVEDLMNFSHRNHLQLASSRKISEWMGNLFFQEMEADRRKLDLLLKKAEHLVLQPRENPHNSQEIVPPRETPTLFDLIQYQRRKKKIFWVWGTFLGLLFVSCLGMLYFLLWVEAPDLVQKHKKNRPNPLIQNVQKTTQPPHSTAFSQSTTSPTLPFQKTTAPSLASFQGTTSPLKNTKKEQKANDLKVSFQLFSEPSGADFYIEGDLIDKTPKNISFEREKDSYSFVFKKAGYENFSKIVRLKKDQTTYEIHALLKKKGKSVKKK